MEGGKSRRQGFWIQWPLFFASASPLVADGLCLVHLGGNKTGVFVAVEVNTGRLRWRWTGDGPSYSSPVLMTVAGVLVALTEKSGLVVFKPNAGRYEETVRLNVASTPVQAHPVLSRNRVFVRDADSVGLWLLE